MAAAPSLDDVRAAIERLPHPQVYPRVENDEQFQLAVNGVRAADTLADKLSIAGFTVKPVVHEGVEQACETCMYFLVRRKWCDRPDLDIPVEPQWSCRLWRI